MEPLRPHLQPMLARLARELPRGDYLYEPKWDGFRCLVFRDEDHVDLRSRRDRSLTRYFPELAEAVAALPQRRLVLDGEIVAVGREGFDFEALMTRLHPAASRVARLRRETPASFIAFDILAEGQDDLRGVPFEQRRGRLEQVLATVGPPTQLTPITDDPAVAEEWLERFQGVGIDGVVAKARSLTYQPGKRAMVKVKLERTLECVVAGYRPYVDSPVVASLLLGLYDEEGTLQHVGVASQFSDRQREELREELSSLIVPLERHPWKEGFLLGGGSVGRLAGSAGRWTPDMAHDWVPLRPERVCEVAYDHVDGVRFRFPVRFRRWRPDRTPHSCTIDQLEVSRPEVPGLAG
ncbi:MAG TPA: ATP-dependent DNA ligase [Actinomycetota bacterium]|nr:ATP-dependent DNA ligase [Actinomycetota bacterium]